MRAEVIHGDCLEVMRGMPDASVDAVVADPPYGTRKLGGGYGRKHATIANDDDLSKLRSALPEIARVLKPDAFLAVFCAAKKRHDVDTLLLNTGFPLFGEVVWDKGAPGLGFHIRYAHETVIVCRRGEPRRPATPLMSVIRVSNRGRVLSHPHEKPLTLMANLVAWACPPGGVVLDPFCGSGSTCVAAIRVGRDFIGIEDDATHYATAVKRIADAQSQLTLGVA